ncbi:MAG: MFS transporter [Candidatus Eremiobacteraeota bacterium]|nr:MFS transporter [Candidatus Eremiobacteraeota bacterium]
MGTRRRFFYGWTIVVALGVTTIVSYGTNQYLFGLLVDPLAREFGWDKASIGLAFSGVVLVSGLAGLVFGRIVDRLGARLPLAIGSLINGLSLLAISRAHDLLAFDLLWTFGIGLGSALTFYPVSMTVVANWFARRRTQAFSLLSFMGAFSSTFTYPIAGLLIARYGWRDALVVLAAVHLLVAFPLHVLVVRRHPEDLGLLPDGDGTATAAEPVSGVAYGVALRSASFWLLTIGIALGAFASTGVLLEQVAYLIARGYAPSFAATLVGLFGLAYLPGRVFVAWSGERLSLALLFAGAFALEALGVTLLATAPTLLGVLAYVCTFGAAYGATFPLRGSLMAQRFGRRAYGSIIAAQGVPVGIGAALGPVAVGRLIDTVGYGAGFSACIAALLAAAAIVAIPVRAPRGLAASPAYAEPYHSGGP